MRKSSEYVANNSRKAGSFVQPRVFRTIKSVSVTLCNSKIPGYGSLYLYSTIGRKGQTYLTAIRERGSNPALTPCPIGHYPTALGSTNDNLCPRTVIIQTTTIYHKYKTFRLPVPTISTQSPLAAKSH